MSARVPEMLRRQRAVLATLARYRGKAFSWREGITCVHLARAHCKHMGHTVPTMPRFRSAMTAREALAARGWADVPAMLDSLLVQIPPAAMALGDVAVLPGEDGLGAIYICAGPRRLFGWIEGEPLPQMIEPNLEELIAWRV